MHATSTWSEPAGGGAVIASQINRLAGGCDFFTALGDDEIGRESERAADRARPRRCTSSTRLDRRPGAPGRTSTQQGERTITLLSEKLLPLGAAAARRLRRRVLRLGRRRGAAVGATCAVRRRHDPRSSRRCARAASRSTCSSGASTTPANGSKAVSTCALSSSPTARGAASRTASAYDAVEPPGPIVDTYGAGDSFSAALLLRARARRRAAGCPAARRERRCSRDHGAGPVHGQLTLAG